MTYLSDLPPTAASRAALYEVHGADEEMVVTRLLAEADLDAGARQRIEAMATTLVASLRASTRQAGGMDAFMHEYDLSSQEGVMLMCLAEALLRIPDTATADRLIADKIGSAHWEEHFGRSESLFVNASTWALMLTGRLVRMAPPDVREPRRLLRRLIARSGEPVIRNALLQAMRIMGRQFVMGRTIDEALQRARPAEARGDCHSYDMLGESAHTAAAAERYFRAYQQAVAAVGKESGGRGPFAGPGISIKLSALHSRFETTHHARLARELVPRVKALAEAARTADIGLCVDTEEADRLHPTLDVVEAVFSDPMLQDWEGFGLAIQAYQKRGRPLVDWLAELSRRQGRRMSVRLVKGAYWDAEIKRAQERGLDDYPVFTRKANTDVSYVACARALLARPDCFYPQFATHNAQTMAAIIELAGNNRTFEFQRLHGMGDDLYRTFAGLERDVPCRVYAPVGQHEDLLAYLVRRLLENGSNTSFVNRIVDQDLPVSEIVADPVARVTGLTRKRHPRIPAPRDLFGGERLSARGVDLADPAALSTLARGMAEAPAFWQAAPTLAWSGSGKDKVRAVHNPADREVQIGVVTEATPEQVGEAVAVAAAAAPGWSATEVATRALCLDRAAERLEREMPRWMALLVREAGKTMTDAVAEVREAIDFCRYYAALARADFAVPLKLPGPAGETNTLALEGRGVFVCISPWNFPLAIFMGQVTAALVAGNAVVAKPAEQTPLIAAEAVRLLHACGVPQEGLVLMPGDGRIGAALVAEPHIAGVAFTGSVETARAINRALAARDRSIVPLIAETGGQNAMLVDSTALAEQVVEDVITSAFRSTGQRCSALRVLFLQREIAPRVTSMLAGAMAELNVGDPVLAVTDVGPVIDEDAQAMLHAHVDFLSRAGRLVFQVPLDEACRRGTFVAPAAFEIDRLDMLKGEVFGPILHIITFDGGHVERVIDAINGTGYGLTLGVHSRVEGFARRICARVRAGNAYVNRNMVGAVVGVQPFGGEGLSGTGPKAGGPRYLHRFATERCVSINIAAAGGNAQLLSLDDSEDA